MSLIKSEGEEALLQKCCAGGNKRKIGELIESLGLVNGTVGRGAPRFKNVDVKGLHESITQEIDLLVIVYDQTLAELPEYMMRDDIFSVPVAELGDTFGSRIWGRTKRDHLLEPTPNTKYPAALYWDQAQDCHEIRFYIRCWIVKSASRRIRDEDRANRNAISPCASSSKKPGRQKIADLSDTDASDSDASTAEPPRASSSTATQQTGLTGLTERSYRAAPARMYPTPQPHSEPGEASNTRSEARRESEDDNDSLYADAPRLMSAKAQGKRKRVDTQETTGAGKLPKIAAWKRSIPQLPKYRQREDDPFAVPRSPSTAFESTPMPPPFGKRKNRGNEDDSDSEYRPPRDTSVETDQVNVHEVIMQQFAAERNSGADAHRPMSSRTNTRWDIRDSVIPSDEQENFPALSSRFTGINSPLEHGSESSTAIANAESVPQSIVWEEQRFRRELFTLLLSRLNNLRQFSPGQHCQSSEERLDHLLSRFWATDRERLCETFGARFERLNEEFEDWMQMRSLLYTFQATAQFFGTPGAKWKTHLRQITDTGERAEALIALSYLLDAVKIRGSTFEEDRRNEDLRTVFDQLTQFSHGNGEEEFKGVQSYNANILAWFT